MEKERDELKALKEIKEKTKSPTSFVSELLDDVIGSKSCHNFNLGQRAEERRAHHISPMIIRSSSFLSNEGETEQAESTSSVQNRQREIMIIVLHWLYEMGMVDSAYQLARELAIKKAGGKKYNWMGSSAEKSFEEWIQDSKGLPRHYLDMIVDRFLKLSESACDQPIMHTSNTLFSAHLVSELGGKNDILRGSKIFLDLLTNQSSKNWHKVHPTFFQTSTSLEMALNPSLRKKTRQHRADQMEKLVSVTGHIAPVYCCLFDRTGELIVTGGDDHIIKLWESRRGLLIRTLRGHRDVITDLAIDYQNTMLASGSRDGVLRIWCLKTGAPLAVLVGHTASISSVQFSFVPQAEHSYLLSAADDGSCRLWKFNKETRIFSRNPLIYNCKSSPKDEVHVAVFSKGATRFASAGTDSVVRVFVVPDPDSADQEPFVQLLHGHSGPVMTMEFSPAGDRILTGAWDGTARIWSYKKQEKLWDSVALKAPVDDTKEFTASNLTNGTQSKAISRVNVVVWCVCDAYVATSMGDCTIRIWNSKDGALIHTLRGHQDEIFVLDVNETFPDGLLSASYDGLICLWDIISGQQVRTWSFAGYQFLDGEVASTGQLMAFSDMQGRYTIVGIKQLWERYTVAPGEQFFLTDYQPLVRDLNEFVLDAATQVMPHLLPRQPLCDIDGAQYGSQPTPSLDIDLRLETMRIERLIRSIKSIRSDEVFNFPEEKLPLCSSIHTRSTPSATIINQKQTRARRVQISSDSEESEKQTPLPMIDDLDDEDYVETDSPLESDGYGDSGSASDYPEEELFDSEDIDAYDHHSKLKRASDADEGSSRKVNHRRQLKRRHNRSEKRKQTKHRHQGSSSQGVPNKNSLRTPARSESSIAYWKDYLPTDWLVMTHQPPTPYHPQIGDDIAYFRQGHEEFLKNLEDDSFEQDLPWDRIPNLGATAFGTVANLDFRPGRPPYCVVSIVGEDGHEFRVSYFDRIGVSDFIVLRSRYEQGARRRWKTGMQCKAFFDDRLYSGLISGKGPLDENRFPDSFWGCLLVFWEGDDPKRKSADRLSPWELYLPGIDEATASRPLESLDEEVSTYLIKSFDLVKRSSEAAPFIKDVDFSLFPAYCTLVGYPICLSRIIQRLNQAFYRRLEAVVWDVDRLLRNAKEFNLEHSQIVKDAKVIHSRLSSIISNAQDRNFGDIEGSPTGMDEIIEVQESPGPSVPKHKSRFQSKSTSERSRQPLYASDSDDSTTEQSSPSLLIERRQPRNPHRLRSSDTKVDYVSDENSPISSEQEVIQSPSEDLDSISSGDSRDHEIQLETTVSRPRRDRAYTKYIETDSDEDYEDHSGRARRPVNEDRRRVRRRSRIL